MYGLFSGNTQIDTAARKDEGIEQAQGIVLTRNGGTPRSIIVRPLNGRAKGKPVEVVALGHQRTSYAVRDAA